MSPRPPSQQENVKTLSLSVSFQFSGFPNYPTSEENFSVLFQFLPNTLVGGVSVVRLIFYLKVRCSRSCTISKLAPDSYLLLLSFMAFVFDPSHLQAIKLPCIWFKRLHLLLGAIYL